MSPCGGIEIAEWPRPCRAPWPWAASDNPNRGGVSRGASRQGARPGRRGEIRFTSSILPKWARRTKSLDPLSTGDLQEALSALLGKDAPNISPVRRLKGLRPKLRYPQLDLAGLGLQLAFVMPGSAIAASLSALVTLSIAQLIRLDV